MCKNLKKEIITAANLLHIGEVKSSTSCFKQIRFKANKVKDYNNAGIAESYLAYIYSNQHNSYASIKSFEKAKDYFIQASNNKKVTEVNVKLSSLYIKKRDFQRGNYYLKITKSQATIDKGIKTDILLNQAAIEKHNAKYTEAINTLKKAIAICDTTSEKGLVKTACLGNIGSIYMTTKDYDNALTYYRMGLEIAEKIRSKSNEAIIIRKIGMLYLQKSSFIVAENYLNKAKEMQEQMNNRIELLSIHEHLAKLWQACNKPRKALADYKKAREYARLVAFKRDVTRITTIIDGIDYIKKMEK